MIYVLAEIEGNYIFEHVFDDKKSYFTNYTSMLDINITGVKLPLQLALDSKTSSKFEFQS